MRIFLLESSRSKREDYLPKIIENWLTYLDFIIILQENPQSFALKMFDRSKQQVSFRQLEHPCSGGDKTICQDLCLVIPENGHSCKCRDGSQLQKDGVSCQEIPNWKPPSHCRPNQFKCQSNFKCIDERYT